MTSISTCEPGLANSLFNVASPIIFFKTGDQVVEVALPICLPFLKTGTATREAIGETTGGKPTAS